jgi:hypothetical protein
MKFQHDALKNLISGAMMIHVANGHYNIYERVKEHIIKKLLIAATSRMFMHQKYPHGL